MASVEDKTPTANVHTARRQKSGKTNGVEGVHSTTKNGLIERAKYTLTQCGMGFELFSWLLLRSYDHVHSIY